MGMGVRIAGPTDFQPLANLGAEMQKLARTTGAHTTIKSDPLEAVAGCRLFLHQCLGVDE